MKAWAIIGYAYEADLHCAHCTRMRFPEAGPAGFKDQEGNPVHPIFAGDEHDPAGEFCEDCGAELWEPANEEEEDDDAEK